MKRLMFVVCACLGFAQPLLHAASPLIISEFMASNTRSLTNAGQTADWIEIQNVSSNSVSLLNWSLTDSAGNLAKWRFPATNISAGGFMVVFAMSPERAVPGAPLQTGFSLSAGGEYLALVDPTGVIATEFSPSFPPQIPDVSYGAAALTPSIIAVASNGPARVSIPANGNDGTNWMLASYNDSAWTAGLNGIGYSATANTAVRSQTRTDVGTVMSNVNATAYIRLPFVVENPTSITLVTLRMRYDDGFAAFINGIPVAQANAPATLAFNSAATGTHSASTLEEFRFGTLPLKAGTNILAIQGLNQSAADIDFLAASELILTGEPSPAPGPLYFTTATPGAANSAGIANPGPAIYDVTHTPNVPLDNEDIQLTLRLSPTFFAISNVIMRYRVMFDAEVEVQMLDDGLHGDGAAGDGQYGATIPASVSTNSQMVRWFFRATDVQGNQSRYPLFANPADSAEYLGTIVDDSYVTSKLPIFHLYAPANILNPGPTTTQTAADSQNGAKVSVFHKGEFYDNVSMQLRGNSTAGYNKKSHRLEFNREHLLRHDGPGPRLRNTSFVADYPDPTYMRQGLSYWLCDIVGAPAPFYQPVRLQLNGRFYQLANHNDLHGDELLSRLGYDPNGALYNAAGQVTPGRASTGGFEKKTRKWDNDNDYTALANAIAEALPIESRGSNFFENFDVPNAISYAVAARWVHENDDVWANMSLYHDNDGDNEWSIVPFDLNLSWGAIFAEGAANLYTGVQSTNDTHKSHPLYGSSQTLALSGPGGAYNRVYDVIFRHPVLREMYLRRLRTVMDTVIQAPDTPLADRIFENEILTRRDLIADEAVRDRAWWGWPGVGGQGNFTPGIGITNGVDDMISEFIGKRRIHFFNKHVVTAATTAFPIGITKTNNAGIPLSQSPTATIAVHSIEFNPSSGNQDQEYICLTNSSSVAIDISGWSLTSAVEFTFRPGTVVPSLGSVYVSPNVRAFRSRPSGPRGAFVVGPYSGQLSARGETVIIVDPTGRIVSTNSYVGNPSLVQQNLRVTEIMYNPTALAGNTNDAQEFEYIEVKNISTTQTLNLAGVRFINGIEFTFTGSQITSLSPGARALIVRNVAAFTARYGNSQPIAGVFAGSLDSNGERIRVVDAAGEEVLDFSYNNSWYPVTDGLGFSLAGVDENAAPDDWSQKGQWRPSGQIGGTPGANDPTPPVFVPVLVNEVLSASTFPQVDAVEIYNPSTNIADIGGWYISDDVGEPKKYRIANGTTIPAGGYIVFDESQFNVGEDGFAFSSDSDEAWIFSGNASGELTGYAQGVSFGAAEAGVSFGRYVNSVGDVHFVAQSSVTLGAVNAGPKLGPVVISEIMYHPIDIGTNDNSADEFIELRNISATDVLLYDAAAPTNTWRLTELVGFKFPEGQIIPAGKFAIVANIDPADAAALATLRAKYGLASDVPVYGPYAGKLDNSGGRIELKKPGVTTTNGTPYIIVDEVEYSDEAPWPVAADGGGPSLQRVSETAYGNDPANWVGVGPSAGVSYVPGGTPPTITAQPASVSGVEGRSVTLNVQVTGTAPFFYQWRFNGRNITGANTAQLSLNNLQTRQAGFYSVVIFNSAGSIESDVAQVIVLLPPYITGHPVGRSVYIKPDPSAANLPNGTNVTFSVVAASGNSALSYQWQFNGVNIPGANDASYTVEDVQVEDEGDYRVLVSDTVDTVTSAVARLVPWIRPSFIQRPTDLVVAEGSEFSLSTVVTGNPRDFSYSWRRNVGSVVVSTNASSTGSDFITLNTTNALLLLTNNILSSNFVMRIVVYNDAFRAPGLTTTFNIRVLADSDRDGIPDIVELDLGLDANNLADALGDLDGDGMNNRAEYVAGTDPTNSLSYLKIEENVVTGSATVLFSAVSNRTYSVQYTDALGTQPWQKLFDVAGRATNFVAELPDPDWRPQRFYRAVTPWQP